MIAEWCQHRHESVVSVRQGESAEFVKHFRGVGNGWILPMNVLLVDTLREEGYNLQKLAGIGSEFLEFGQAEGKLDRCREAPGVCCPVLSYPFCDQSVGVPLVLLRGSGEQGDGERMEVELLQDAVDRVGPPTVLVDTIERVTGGLHRQCRYFERLAIRRDDRNTGGN